MESSLFDEVADALRGMAPDELGAVRVIARRWGIKVWFGAEEPPREHYEAQVIAARHVRGARTLALEVGFHAEHPQAERNDEVVRRIVRDEAARRARVGDPAVAGPFLGRDAWRRISETWADPDLDDPALPMEIAVRLVDYVTALEPCRAGRVTTRPRRAGRPR